MPYLVRKHPGQVVVGVHVPQQPRIAKDVPAGQCESIHLAGVEHGEVALAGARFEPVEGYWQMSERERHEADAAYIAAVSPDVMLALLDEKAALRKTLAWLQMALNWAVFCDHPQVGASNEMRDIRGRVDAALNPEVHE